MELGSVKVVIPWPKVTNRCIENHTAKIREM